MKKEQAESFVREWFHLADSHASVALLLERVDMTSFEVYFQQQRLNCAAYAEWYVQDIRSFFNGEHKVLDMHTEIQGERAVVTNRVRWSGESWLPPAAKSTRREVDCVIRFTMEKRPERGIVLLKYESL